MHTTAVQRSALHSNVVAAGFLLEAPVSWQDLVMHRPQLVRFAQRRLRDPMLAEDLVHDVFEAVMTGRASFAGRSSLRSWLTAILKHKIVDLVRQRAPFDSLDAPCDEDGDDSGSGALRAMACPHAGPHELAEHRERLALTLKRIDALPAGLRDAMQQRVLLERSTAETCDALSITADNLFVRLHRARKQLLP